MARIIQYGRERRVRHSFAIEQLTKLTESRLVNDTTLTFRKQIICQRFSRRIRERTRSWFTDHTPKEFPNRLTKDGTEESDFDKLKDAIAKVEDEITAALATDDEGLIKWNEALKIQKTALQKELDFLEAAQTLRPVRYYDVRYIMQTELLKSRLTFLLTLKAETGH